MTFTEKVYKIAESIPEGRVATYKQIATLAGIPNASRAVGMSMKKNPYAPRVPCHRVVSSDGRLNGYSGIGGIEKKKKMLIEEGVLFNNDKIDLAKSLWKK
jgi:O-6-methylguanine DNA methyltransferase